MEIACAVRIIKSISHSIWIPPKGRPYWVVAGRPNAGPHLTDNRLKRFGLFQFMKYPFDKIWAKSVAISYKNRNKEL